MCMTMAKSLCTIMTRDYLDSRKRASDAVNITSLTTQLFYAVLLDFMTAYQLVGFNAKLTTIAVTELKGCDNIEENMLKYVTNYSGDNVNSKKDLRDPGKNMLGELQKPKYDPNFPNKKRTQMKVLPARLCGGGITTKWMQSTDTCYPCLVEVLMLVMVRKLFDEAKISNKEKKTVEKDDTLPFANRKFRFKKMKLERQNEEGKWVLVSSLEEMRPKTNVNSMGQGYITLTDMVMKAFPIKDKERAKKLRSDAFDAFTVKNIFDYSLPKPPISEDDDDNDDDNDNDNENNNDDKNGQSTEENVIDTWQEVINGVINGDDFNTHIQKGVDEDVNEFDVTDEIKKKMKDTITARVITTLKEAHKRSLKLEEERTKGGQEKLKCNK
jgi:hypothetical protein